MTSKSLHNERTDPADEGKIRLILASDLSRGGDFVGSATCKARNRVIPSSFIVGPGLSDGPVRLHHGWDSTEMNFPIVATF